MPHAVYFQTRFSSRAAFTSSKGAILTHGSLVANIEQTSTWIGSTPTEGEEVAITPPLLVEGNADQPDLDQADQEGQSQDE